MTLERRADATMLRPLVPAAVMATLAILTLPPAGALNDGAGHGYAYQAVFAVEQGGETFAFVTLWNNGTTDDTASFAPTKAADQALYAGPNESILVHAGSSMLVPVKVRALDVAPGVYTVPMSLGWASGAQQSFDVPVRVVLAHWGLSVAALQDPVPFDSRGKSADMRIVVTNDGDEALTYVTTTTLYGRGPQEPTLRNRTAAATIQPHANETRTVTLDWGRSGWWPPRTGSFPVNVSLEYSTHAATREYPFTYVTLDVNESASEGATIDVTPHNATGTPGGTFPYHATIVETSGNATTYHLDVNATDASPDAPRLQIDNMIMQLQPRERRELDFAMTTTGSTPPREYRVVATLTSESSHVVRAETFALLDLRPPENVTMIVTPTHAEVAPGENASFDSALSERMGRATGVHMSYSVVSGTAPDLYFGGDTSPMTIDANGTRSASLYVRAATNATPGERIIRIEVVSTATGRTLAAQDVSFSVRAPLVETAVSLDVSPGSADLALDSKTAFQAFLNETAGLQTRVRLAIAPTPALGIPQGPDEITIRSDEAPILLQPHASVVSYFSAYSTNQTRPGTHTWLVRVIDADTGRELASTNVTITVRGPPVFDGVRYHIDANLENDSIVVPSDHPEGELRVHVWQNGSETAHVHAQMNASADAFYASTLSASGDVGAGGTIVLFLPFRFGPNASPAAPQRVLVYVYADNDTTSGWTVLSANVTLGVDVPLMVATEPTAAARGETANFTVHVTNLGAQTVRVTLHAPANVTFDATPFDVAPSASVDLRASFTIPDDAEIGSSVARTLVLSYGSGEANATLDATVSPISVPPTSLPPDVAPQADLGSPLKTALDVVVAHPGAAASLTVAAAAVVTLPLARREPWRYVAMAAALPLYTRLAKPHMLADARRGEIHALIVATPGISLSELGRATRLSTGALVHHLRMLERHGFLTSRKDGKLRRFFVVGAAPSALVASPTAMQEQILGLLAARPMTRPEIGAALGLTQQGVSYHVKNLERAGRVIVRREGAEARVHRVYDVVVVTPRVTPRE